MWRRRNRKWLEKPQRTKEYAEASLIVSLYLFYVLLEFSLFHWKIKQCKTKTDSFPPLLVTVCDMTPHAQYYEDGFNSNNNFLVRRDYSMWQPTAEMPGGAAANVQKCK